MTEQRKVIDRRVIWLEGLSIHAATVLKKLQTRQEDGISPTEAETDVIDLCGGYLYLLQLAKEHGLFDSDDPLNLFEKETLH
mgnify:CR=1 FL=1|jgi:hypothetical protein